MSDNQFWAAFGGCMIGFVMIISGVMLAFTGGAALDSMMDALGDVTESYDVSEEWDVTSSQNLAINLFYVLCYAMPILGLGIMYISVTRMMKYDRYEQGMYEDSF